MNLPKACDCLRGILLLAAFWVTPLVAAAGDVPAGSRAPTHGWTHATPVSVGLDETALGALDADLAKGKYGLVDSFEVFRCGAEVYNRKYDHDYATIYAKEAKVKGPLNARLTGRYNYFDPAWHPYYHGTDMHTMQSVSKTVTAVIIGVAITRGDFKATVDEPVLRYFDLARVKNVDDRKQRMTLRDVLTMTTGLQWDEDDPYDDPRNDASAMEATDDWVQYTIDKPMAHEPGKVFNYNSGATELLAYIFQKQTGQDIESYGEKNLFTPLGIRHYWKHNYQGLVDTEGGLYLSGADLAKIGYLHLKGGIWDGQRLLSEAWMRQSLKPAIDTGWQGLQYGFKWWLQPRKGSKEYIWHGIGFGGQRVMVFPAQQMIATFTGWDILKDIEYDSELANRLLPAVHGGACR
ncbi:MAG TPA: serine hydrolase [Steroidobacteraceae bacterium]|nr:serine hydrolase [Steroidobacteraceae bacterium]